MVPEMDQVFQENSRINACHPLLCRSGDRTEALHPTLMTIIDLRHLDQPEMQSFPTLDFTQSQTMPPQSIPICIALQLVLY
mmetsp:Transcript_78071/g.137764  ORF Transcript_78071/g.137764 Transcript_78071/m.137764 type:complete len:81 (-) Transcript_78071:46-288(-)